MKSWYFAGDPLGFESSNHFNGTHANKRYDCRLLSVCRTWSIQTVQRWNRHWELYRCQQLIRPHPGGPAFNFVRGIKVFFKTRALPLSRGSSQWGFSVQPLKTSFSMMWLDNTSLSASHTKPYRSKCPSLTLLYPDCHRKLTAFTAEHFCFATGLHNAPLSDGWLSLAMIFISNRGVRPGCDLAVGSYMAIWSFDIEWTRSPQSRFIVKVDV